jgi:D-alanyl-D-alanine carboxypeptidase
VFSGVALIARHGEPVFHRAYGLANRSNATPNTTRTRFNLGSINKIFTQTAIEQLIAQDKLTRATTLGSVLPDHPQEVTRAATIEQLLEHTAGLPDFFGQEFSNTSKARFRNNADYYQFVASTPPLFAPGARNQYCNGTSRRAFPRLDPTRWSNSRAGSIPWRPNCSDRRSCRHS